MTFNIGIGEIENVTAYKVFTQDVSAASSVTVGLGSSTAASGTWVAPVSSAFSVGGTRIDVTFTLGAGHLAAVGRVWAWVKIVDGGQTLIGRLLPQSYVFLDQSGTPLTMLPGYVPMQATAPDHTAFAGWLDTSTVPPALKGWNGTAWVAIGGGGGVTVTDNGNGTLTLTGTPVVDNSDGTFTVNDPAVTDHGDGTFIAA